MSIRERQHYVKYLGPQCLALKRGLLKRMLYSLRQRMLYSMRQRMLYTLDRSALH